MTTYRLPDGTRVDSIDPDGRQQIHGSMTWITHPELGPIAISTDKLTEVEPPLPPQPEYGEFVACGTDGNLLPIYRRWLDPDGWGNVSDRNSHEVPWAEVCMVSRERAGRNPVRLIADPADDAPELPWTVGDHKDRIGVTDNHLVWVNLKPDYHSPDEAELRAKAILRAVREARAAREAEQP